MMVSRSWEAKLAKTATQLTAAPTQSGVVADQLFDAAMVNVRDFDALDVLPTETSAAKLRLLRERSETLFRMIPPFAEVEQTSIELVKAETELRRLGDAYGLPPSDPRILSAKKRVDKLSAEFARVRELKEARSAAWQAASRVLSAVEDFLKSGRPAGTTLDAAETEVKLAKGESIIDAVANRRKRVIELKASLARISAAPLPHSFARAAIKKQLELLAAKGAPVVTEVIAQPDGRLRFPQQMLRSQVFNIPKSGPVAAYTEQTDVLAILCWMFEAEMLAKLDAVLDSSYSEADDEALTVEARHQRITELTAQLIDVERQESFLVWRAMDERLPVEHRADCAPQALLQCRLVTAPRVVPTMGSSPQHATAVVGT
jgi:hypothetical protein